MTVPGKYFLRTLSDISSGRTVGVACCSFLASAHMELCGALTCSQGFVHRASASASANLLARASVGAVLKDSDVPLVH